MIRKKFLLVLVSVFITFSLFAQQKDLPKKFGKFELGMSVEQVKQILLESPEFNYRGDRDVSFLPDQERIMISTDSTSLAEYSFFSKSYFQFKDDKLYSMIFYLNPQKIDYYTIFSFMNTNLGNPNELDPTKATWTDSKVIVSLEKPLVLKYVDNVVFEKMLEGSKAADDLHEESVKEFLERL